MLFLINTVSCLIPMPTLRRQVRQKLRTKWNKHKNNPNVIINHIGKNTVMLWIDHALGGGTEVYSKRQFKEQETKCDIIRLQYFPATELYHITHATNKKRCFKTKSLHDVYQFCYGLNISEIVVNNIVAYKSAIDILQFVKTLKKNAIPQPRVSFRLHDFHCICPSFNLIDCDGKYCAMKYKHGCEKCWENKKLAANITAHNVLKSGAKKICDWRTAWGNFFEDTVDSIIVFSESAEHLFTQMYPQAKSKIIIVPHTVCDYKTVQIKPHNKINIAVLGAISYQKGANVIREMAQYLPIGTSIKVIGTMNDAPNNIFVYGKYKPSKLPRIMKKHEIDLVFIPSIWPETFSYTTSEAISMGLPVACYDIGAPAERVSRYSRGLVLKEIAPRKNLIEITNFIKKQRQQI